MRDLSSISVSGRPPQGEADVFARAALALKYEEVLATRDGPCRAPAMSPKAYWLL
jgi:hypothetical protein